MNKKIIFINGYNSPSDGGDLYRWLKDYLPAGYQVDLFPLQTDPEVDQENLLGFPWKNYDLCIGFSLGGRYACAFSPIKNLVINPGYGVSLKDIRFTRIDSIKTKNHDTWAIFGEQDPHLRLERTGFLKDSHQVWNILGYFPGGHIPTESEMKKCIIPEIINL